MTFGESINFCLTKGYAKFQGRATRSEFWWFFLFSIAISTLIGLFAIYSPYPLSGVIFVFEWIIILSLFLPNMSVSVRRFHDLNFSAWWALSFYAFCFVWLIIVLAISVKLVLLKYFISNTNINLNPLLVSYFYLTFIVIVLLIPYLIICVFEGTRGVNRFGEDPLEKEIF